VGWLGVAASFIIMTYYSVLAGWGLNYVLLSLNQFYVGRSAQEISQVFDTLAASGDITLFWQFLFMVLTVAVVYPGVRQGIEFWSKFMTTTLLVLLVGLCIFATTLSGFGEAVHFIFYPDLSRFKPSSAMEALGLAFYTMSLGQGIMLTYGSYMRKEDNIPKTSLIIGFMTIVVALLASLTIFPVVFSFGVPPQEGPGLVFKTLPLLFSKLPGALIISSLFFILFVFTALTSAIALTEVVVANFMDLWGWTRHKAVLIVGAAMYICGIPCALSSTDWLFGKWKLIYGKNFFNTMNDLVSFWMIPICGLLIAIYTGWVLDKRIAEEEFKTGSRMYWLWKPWIFFTKWVAPIAILVIIFQKTGVINIDKLVGFPID
jgi:NSS family neurotransmitter:Na+ symporter